MRSIFDQDCDALTEGERFTTGGRTLTEADLVSFASLTGDRHPQHVDAVWAEQSRFGRRIAHGMLLISYAVGLVPLDPERVVALRRLRDVVFKQPAYVGDTIHVEGRIEAVVPLDERHGLVQTLWKILNQRGRTLARARIEVVWRRDPAEESGAELVPAVEAVVMPL